MKKFIKRGLSLILVAALSLSFNLAFATSEQRQDVVNYMNKMANVPWIAGRDIEYWNPKYGIVFKCGENYFGVPYSQFLRNTSLETFKRLIKSGKYYGICGLGHTIPEGSDCSSAVSMAWQLLNKDIPYLSTYDMIPTLDNPYIVKVGNYNVPEDATTSIEIIKNNEEDAMYNAYSELRPGDAVVTRGNDSGHVVLVKEVDARNEEIIGIGQEGVNENGVCLGKDGKSTWRDNRRLSFDELYSKNYIPITIKEFSCK